MINRTTIKIVRLQTGEDIISTITEDSETNMILLNNPMRMIVKRVETGQTVFMMMPWLPIEVIKEDSAIIYNSDIITTIEPKDSLVEYYQNMVNESIHAMLNSDSEEMMFDDDYEEYEMTEEDLHEVEEYKRTKLLH
jgi:hypothetical protein